MQALYVLALFAGLALAQTDNLRGVNPDLASHYSGKGGAFTCISGIPKTIPFSRVNDDYCDCPDGSDEPGTSACHNGRFYCRNLGHESRLLASAFVDDGVCDCCDGADEPKGKCQNTCLQAAAVRKEELRGKIQLHEHMLNRKKEYTTKASTFKEELKLKAETIDEDIARQQAEIDNLKGEVTRLEAEEAARQAEIAAANQAAEEARKAEAEAQAEQAASLQGEEAASSMDFKADEGEHAEGQAQQEEREETPEERGRRIASQWTNDPEAAAVPESEGHLNPDDQEEDVDGHYDGTEDDGTEGHFDYPNTEAQSSDYHPDHARRPPRPDPYSPLNKARAAVMEAERKLQGLQKDKENIGTFLHRPLDLGPDDIFLALANKCFTSYQTRWTYEICMFDKAVQKEGYTNSVVVGRWYGFSDDYRTMYFTGGDECWNVGPRSMTVALSCGWDERLSDGEEPSTCAYAAKLTTPAVCTEAELHELQQQLENLEAFEKEVQEKILKDEL
ncbi:hypothetical protein VOLCADRAFT_120319 [Volvox carteri f. nagariensis]|uniref:Glucosidase 2 subunit beta n=1 Tax=Volvox carteri f. nagariensis TaxID=3068 RepID=D8TJM5_VOLCA|nr:uncharacterized protein VOLCADRAFT_120319 [Volvox carteri f. nagariensis]EFJ52398.1 hypothetical protein VOLCADRAFT_120319 [Volvox carteri f. nagariensis]|eukprot:XP_002946471.1 hypothetical protein VOLCADRAFT_120319 [Volvox carteri f. nagariensis]